MFCFKQIFLPMAHGGFSSLIFSKSYSLTWTENGLGYILGEFFSNVSGHPVSVPSNNEIKQRS
jgi:hypothetical protein